MEYVFSPSGFFTPQLSVEVQAAIRVLHGCLMFITLVMVLPQARRFFISEKWGGYGQSAADVNCIQNPVVMPVVYATWLACALGLITNTFPVAAAFISLVFARYFFVSMRWKGCLRGFGAPGFMTYWLCLAVFLLESTLHYAPKMRPLAILVTQADFAFIMLSAGLYKFTAGYARNNGMEYGMVNPQWGYWWTFFQKLSPQNPFFAFNNFLAWSVEIAAAILMLIPETRFIGGSLILLSFIYIFTQIRLGVLCEVVITCCLLFFHPGSLGEKIVTLVGKALGADAAPALSAFPTTEISAYSIAIGAAMGTYLLLLPLCHASLFYNFYGKKALPGFLQTALEKYTNFFGIIIWRVFSADHTNFYPVVYRLEENGQRVLISNWGKGLRYNNVGESIVLTCLFTTLKYYASNQDLFNERLLRYTRTLPKSQEKSAVAPVFEFEYRSIKKLEDRFEPVPVARYIVKPETKEVIEEMLDKDFSTRASSPDSPIKEGVRPGSYVSLGK